MQQRTTPQPSFAPGVGNQGEAGGVAAAASPGGIDAAPGAACMHQSPTQAAGAGDGAPGADDGAGDGMAVTLPWVGRG